MLIRTHTILEGIKKDLCLSKMSNKRRKSLGVQNQLKLTQQQFITWKSFRDRTQTIVYKTYGARTRRILELYWPWCE